MKIRKLKPEDVKEIHQLHLDTVKYVNSKDYSPDQIKTWPKVLVDPLDPMKKFKDSIAFVALINNKIVGFGNINKNGHLHRIYTHKDYQGKGIGSAIYNKLEETAKKLGIKEINLVSTITAKEFYLKKGFKLLGEKRGLIDGVEHIDFEMKKKLE